MTPWRSFKVWVTVLVAIALNRSDLRGLGRTYTTVGRDTPSPEDGLAKPDRAAQLRFAAVTLVTLVHVPRAG